MSLGCGTLASPSGFAPAAASSTVAERRLQHTLPAHPKGDDRQSEGGDAWRSGEYWNVDSNITRWGRHEVRREQAVSSHAVHRHDQITRVTLKPQPGEKQKYRALNPSTSGMLTADGSFLSAQGFGLGDRDRNGRPMLKEGKPRWQTISRGEQFRAADSFPCDATERANAYRTMRRSTSSPATSATEAHSGKDADLTSGGTLFGSRSCWGWDCHGHASRREAAKTSLGVHSPMAKVHSQAYPFKEGGLELQPAAIYTRNFRQHGEDSLRVHKPQHVRGNLGSGTKKAGRVAPSAS